MTTIPNPDNESGVLTLFWGLLATIANLATNQDAESDHGTNGKW